MMESNQNFKVAIIGQSNFAAKLYEAIKKDGHEVSGVFTIPDKNNREDPLAQTAAFDGTPVFKIKAWKSEGLALPEVLEQYQSIEIDLNVLSFCTESIPMEVINYPRYQSICFHPSILPRHRGASAISWTLIEGDETAGFSVFWADDGLDTGPILLQRDCKVAPNDTLESLYNRFIHPEGTKAMVEAINLVAESFAPKIPQSKKGATYNPMLDKKELQQIDWKNNNAKQVHDFIRALDSIPGAWTFIDGEEVRFYGSSLWNGNETPVGDEVNVDGQLGMVSEEGLLIRAEGGWVKIAHCKIGNRTINASEFGKAQNGAAINLEFTEDEQQIVDTIKNIWQGILDGYEIGDDTDFFACGASSVDVVRLVEELRHNLNIELRNIVVFMAPVFSEFAATAILAKRADSVEIDDLL